MDQLTVIKIVVDVIIFVLFILWVIPWKIYAVWTAVKQGHRKWFVALLFLNTMSILEMIYIFKIVDLSWDDVKKDFKYGWNYLLRKGKDQA